MRWRIGAIGSTEIWLHPATLLTAGYMICTGFGGWFAAALISIVLHEAAHAAVSTAFGKPPREIELTPLGMLMRLEEDEALPPLKRFLTVLAGPGMTLLLCTIALAGTKQGLLSYGIGRALFMGNLSILLMNLLPALPLDGGRLLAQLLSLFLPVAVTNRILRALGTLTGLLCIALNLYLTWRLGGWNLSLTGAGCFLIYSAAVSTTSQAMAQLRSFTDRKIRLESKGSLLVAWMAACDSLTAQQAARRMHPRRYTIFAIVERGTQKRLGILHEQEVIAACLASPSVRLGELAAGAKESKAKDAEGGKEGEKTVLRIDRNIRNIL